MPNDKQLQMALDSSDRPSVSFETAADLLGEVQSFTIPSRLILHEDQDYISANHRNDVEQRTSLESPS